MLQIVKQIRKKNGEIAFVHPHGFPKGLQVPNVATLFKSLSDILKTLGPDNQENIFWVVAHHTGLNGPLPSRSWASFEYQTVVPFDIDKVDTTRAMDYANAVASVLKMDPAHLIVVNSGNGVQVLAHLKTPIRSAKFLKELKEPYNELCYLVSRELKQRQLPFEKVDPVVIDGARVLRLPGTLNRKPNIPDKLSALVQYHDAQQDLDIVALSGFDRHAKENVGPDQLRQTYPKPDFFEMAKECRFTNWALTAPQEVHEPQLFSLISLLAAQDQTLKILHDGKERTPRELAEWVFDRATNSPSLARGTFPDKWEAASRYGAQKCKTIEMVQPGPCSVCPHRSKIPTPVALKGPDHISSEENGFWILNKNGFPIKPHYSDLVKVYAKEHTFITTPDARVMAFHGTHYTETTALEVKAWMERKMKPDDFVTANFRQEFLKKVETVGCVSLAEQNELFEESIKGKLNLKNGILDVPTGELIPHTPKIGFRHVLPYDYLPDEASEFFMDWLALVMQDRVELMEAVMDMMGYVLYPHYDDHVFAYLVGEGKNGKSTLLHIIQAMIGKENFSAVSIQQLGGNRFAPAHLDGKLANLSEESSGYEMGIEEMNVIKTLSAGGEMMAERKGEQGYTFKNSAKLVFSANKTPRFREDGPAISRRMLVIPFDHQIEVPDANVEHRLLEEVPKIASMLIRRIAENLKQNDGLFKVGRGGLAGLEAQQKVLSAGNTVVEWGTEHIESSPMLDPEQHYIIVHDAYKKYTAWCEEVGYGKAATKNSFSRSINSHVLVAKAKNRNDNVVRVNEKILRVFKQAKWKESTL